MVGSAAVSMDNQSTGSSPQVASSQDLQQILTMQQRMMSILEHLPQSTNLMNTSSSTASSPLRPLQDGSGSAATQLTTTTTDPDPLSDLSLIHISEPTRLLSISYAVFCLKKKNKKI
eukprot:TRINITY_DN38642_c0_g1_i1.p1 TRINITY_DN38642_c0_g1~~TRINITY_DN38642_c0_g1_i1.p1  ORF type:complete len:117 (-),score=29.19 TRINITY_DN38642_c0_g1_i1:124-474(-)